jgi:hypothetical protein
LRWLIAWQCLSFSSPVWNVLDEPTGVIQVIEAKSYRRHPISKIVLSEIGSTINPMWEGRVEGCKM